MNLGLGIDTALPPAGGTDASAVAGTSTPPGVPSVPGTPGANGKANPAAAVFGQLMAKALQQHAQRDSQGQDKALATDAADDLAQGAQGQASEAALLAMLGAADVPGMPAAPAAPGLASTDSLAPQDPAGKDSTDAALAQNLVTQGLPMWMPPSTGMPAVQHITVGPSLQAITGVTPPPDAHSLAAFARQQGLDTAAIAWLMNPAARGGSDLPLPSLRTAVPSAPTLPTTVAAPSNPAGSLSLNPLASSAALPVVNTAAGTQPALLPSAAPGAAAGSMSATVTAAGANAPAHGVATGAAAGLTPDAWLPPAGLTASPDTASQGAAHALDMASGSLSQLRWSQTLAAAQANPQNPAGASVNQPATSTAWATISLDLSSDAGDTGGSDEPADSANSGGLSSAPAAAPMASDGQGLHKAQALTFQARLVAQAGMASGLSQTSDQMQQLSEKMADAIGERMLQELEKGQLNLRLSLKPAHLGHIEVEMRLRAGELDATFAAPQAATRELLQDGLARLRDSLAQAGMDVANLNVKNGQNRQNGGDSTAGQRKSAPKTPSSEATDAPAASIESTPRPRRSDGWDVMV